MEERIQAILKERFGRDLDNCTKSEIFEALMVITKQEMAGRKRNTGSKKLYYISAEFLIGKLLSNNLINLGMYEEVEKALATHGRELTEIEEMEMEPSLGNGGLGRLAACFLDSIATLGLPGDGIGLNYHFGLFRQLLVDHKQKEVKNPWITNESWLVRQPVSFAVPYKNFTMHSTLYDIDVPGYNNGCNRLHLFDVDTVDESIVPSDSINFDKHQIQKNLTLFLYPDDSDRAGQLLRIYQQYFMVSNGAQFILMECEQKGYDLHKLYDHVVIQINDTHPSMVIPELIRLLQERGFTMQEAIDVVSKTCAYTNHTILAEALEKWPIDYLEEVVPHLMPIIHELDAQAKKKYKDNKKVLAKLEEIKHNRKLDLKQFLYETQNIALDENSIIDVQVKRLHEYKRQQMNALYAIYKYMDIKSGNKPKTPITMVFGAKAAPAYIIAKDIIHLILCLQELIDNDPEVSPYFKVIMLENYNVSKAAKVIPAADISEQISLASKEASGTGNMKFMLNGALTLGTEDGANVEIGDLVGKENIYIFGKRPQDVIDLYADAAYCSKDIYDADPEIAKLVDFIVSDELLAIGDKVCLERLYKEILNKDWFMTLLDLKEYIKTKERVYKDYENKDAWNKKCLINIAKAGFFSSDRTIAQYNEDIWHLA